MHGTNPIRQPIQGDSTHLDIQEIFPTLQGEGPHAGKPAVFIRLGGCNLACDFCDTEFESFTSQPLASILQSVHRHSQNTENTRTHPLIVLTGGEPLRQPIAPLCEALLEAGHTIQIETNGTLYRPLPSAVQMVVSPKSTQQGYGTLREDLIPHTIALKYLVSTHHPHYRTVPKVSKPWQHIPLYVQPMDEYDEARNQANCDYALRLAREQGFTLSLQWHKLLQIP